MAERTWAEAFDLDPRGEDHVPPPRGHAPSGPSQVRALGCIRVYNRTSAGAGKGVRTEPEAGRAECAYGSLITLLPGKHNKAILQFAHSRKRVLRELIECGACANQTMSRLGEDACLRSPRWPGRGVAGTMRGLNESKRL